MPPNFTSRLTALSALAATGLCQSSTTCSGTGSRSAYNASKTYLGCYRDPNVSIVGGAKLSTIGMTPQFCANWCGERGFGYGGIEFGTQCFCGIEPNFDNAMKTNDSSCAPCAVEPSSSCGSGYVMSLYQINNPQGDAEVGGDLFAPACQSSPLCSLPICDTSFTIAERVAWLVGNLTVEEKILNLVDAAAGASRIGLPSYEWWNEATHGVGAAPGVQFMSTPFNFSYATSFPAPITSAAAFDDELIKTIGGVVGIEGRAYGNAGYAGFDYWAPNMNSFRDPRWGRGQETPGEDAFHVSNYVRNYVPGLQGDDPENKLTIATCKHYAVYDIETGRYGNNYNPTQQDVADYFLSPFKTCVRDSAVGSVMCSYNAVDGVPACASEYLLEDVLREHWNFTANYRYVVSDCGAVTDVFQYHNFTESEQDAASVSLNAGTDLECGTSYLKLNGSIAQNDTTGARMDSALTRLYSALFTVGFFDGGKYQNVGWSDVSTPNAEAVAYNAAVEGMVLLKNDHDFLPLKAARRKTKVAIIGPYANATTQMQGDYSGIPPYILSPLSAFQNVTSLDVTYANGADINSNSTRGFPAALAAARDADIVMFFGGIDGSIENEQLDRLNLTWPGNQLDLISQLAGITKPTIVVQFGGGQLDDSEILSNKNIKSLIWAGYPSQSGGTAIADVVTGKQAPAGRLPITQYPASYADEVSIFEINLRYNDTYPGRTYKWYTGDAVLPFGYGLHYTTFHARWSSRMHKRYDIQQLVAECRSEASVSDITPWTTVSVKVTNTGRRASDYVGMLFVSSTNAGPPPRPLKSLVSYGRLHGVKSKTSQLLELPLTLGSIARADEAGDLTIYPGLYRIALDVDEKVVYGFELCGEPAVIESLPAPKASYNYTVPVTVQPPSHQAYS